MREVVKKEVLKLLHAGIIYPVPSSDWVSPVQVVPKKGGMTVVCNDKMSLFLSERSRGGVCALIIENSTTPPRKITFLYLSLMKCLNDLPSIPSFASSTDILGSTKFLSTQTIKARQPSLVLTEPTLIEGCLLGCVMLPHPSKGA
jgi:hypothetical protein